MVGREGLPFLKIGQIIADFQILGIVFVVIDISNKIERGMAMAVAINFKNIGGYPSGDLENFAGSFCSNKTTESYGNNMLLKEFDVIENLMED